MHEKYDLKGSTYKRKASKYERSKGSPTYKDLDFMEIHPEGISLEATTYDALVNTIKRDCLVLESFKIMDYSLLVGVHNLDMAQKEKEEKMKARLSAISNEAARGAADKTPPNGLSVESEAEGTDGEENAGGGGGGRTSDKKSTNLTRSKSINKARLAAYSTAMESIQAQAEPIDEEDDVP